MRTGYDCLGLVLIMHVYNKIPFHTCSVGLNLCSLCLVFLQKKEQELLELSKTVNETRSRMDVAQSELDIYLSQHNTAVNQLNQAKNALQEAVDTLRERRAAIKDLPVKIPQCEEQLKKVKSGNI